MPISTFFKLMPSLWLKLIKMTVYLRLDFKISDNGVDVLNLIKYSTKFHTDSGPPSQVNSPFYNLVKTWKEQAVWNRNTFRVGHFLHGSGSNHDGHWYFETQDSGGHVYLGHVNEYTRAEPISRSNKHAQKKVYRYWNMSEKCFRKMISFTKA